MDEDEIFGFISLFNLTERKVSFTGCIWSLESMVKTESSTWEYDINYQGMCCLFLGSFFSVAVFCLELFVSSLKLIAPAGTVTKHFSGWGWDVGTDTGSVCRVSAAGLFAPSTVWI